MVGGLFMLIVFESRAAARILMLGEHALPVLRAAGKEVGSTLPERGIFTVEQLPEAIAYLEEAIAADEGYVPEDDDEDHPHPMAEKVSLTQRAYPLLDMLRKARAMDTEVMWSPADKGW